MTWRPWIIMTLGIVALLVNGVLMVQEDMPQVAAQQELKKIIEPLRTLTYLESTRRQNFVEMGLSDSLADKAAIYASNQDRSRKKWLKILAQDPAGLGQALCPSDRVPQPYAMLRYLVTQDAGRRYVVSPGRTTVLEPQSWYEESPVDALYDQFEITERRKADATVMAVSSVLLAREMDALNGVSPWSMGVLGNWSFPRLQKREPRITQMVIEYFGLMHYLTELANTNRGICS